jgi:hypothetical protein
MNAIDIAPWIGDWAWSLPLIVLTVVIHVCGLALIGGKFVAVLGESSDARNFHSQICPGDWQYSLVGHRPARNRECDLGRSLSRSRCLARQQVRDALFTQRDDDLRPFEPISERSMAVDGRFGSTKRDVALRADDGISVRHDPRVWPLGSRERHRKP